MAADPLKSAGARLERKAWLNYVRRRLNKLVESSPAYKPLQEIVNYGLTRQKRYDKKVGGLGKK